jgi:hypothetical protein
MTTATHTYASNQLAAFRAVIWVEAVALSVLLWVAILQVIAGVLPA